jgi:hypothetical protein
MTAAADDELGKRGAFCLLADDDEAPRLRHAAGRGEQRETQTGVDIGLGDRRIGVLADAAASANCVVCVHGCSER